MESSKAGPAKTRIRRILLSDFRSYPTLDLAIEADTIVVSGDNGSGKTNLLEAISLFAQGRGLRRADVSACARRQGAGGFAASLELETARGSVQYGTGLDVGEGGGLLVRRYRVDREPVPSSRVFSDNLRLVWLTPAMDSLFNGSPGDRRRFLDRLVLAVDAEHGARVVGMERAMRQRNRILEEGSRADDAWLGAVEREVAALAVAVVAGRAETVGRLNALIASRGESAFPRAEVALAGDFEALCATKPAIEAEDRYRDMLKESRRQDAAAGRALVGPHVADLAVRYGLKGVEAGLCSTGEQKALLVGLVLAHARLVKDVSGLAPVILLDEVAAHFDVSRREALFDELTTLAGQVWMTGADMDAFASIGGKVQRLRVEPGRVDAIRSTGQTESSRR